MAFAGGGGEASALSTSIDLAAGIYKLSATCTEVTPKIYTLLRGSLVVISDGAFSRHGNSLVEDIFEDSANQLSDIATFPLSARSTGVRVKMDTINCANGTAVLERLS